jgi:hypothetical protein
MLDCLKVSVLTKIFARLCFCFYSGLVTFKVIVLGLLFIFRSQNKFN